MGFPTQTHDASGRLRGSYVYLLLCERREIFVKIGISDDPLKRLSSILTGCPFPPGILAVAKLANRSMAITAETALHEAFFRFRSHREWFCFTAADKPEFNRILRETLMSFSSPSLPIEWTKMNIEEMQMQRRQAGFVARKRAIRQRRIAKLFGADEKFKNC